jgi:cytochrome c oxidase subunit 3
MSMWTLLVALLSAIVVWYLIVRKLTARPWAVVGSAEYSPDIGPVNHPARKVALYLFLASITSLFLLFMTAYLMRMNPHHGSDWQSVSKPAVLWINTLLLILSSICLQWVKSIAQGNTSTYLKTGLLLTGIFTIAFIAGQIVAWQQMHDSTEFFIANPAVGFFYLLTGVHALHILGGLFVWGRLSAKSMRGADITTIKQGIELCTVYWHYLLVVWLLMFVLLLTT